MCEVGYQQREQEYRAHKTDLQQKAVDGILTSSGEVYPKAMFRPIDLPEATK